MKGKDLKKKFEKKFYSPKNLLFFNVLEKRDHFMYELFYKQKQVCVFQISRGSQEFGKELIGRMARQLGISSDQLRGIASCTFWAKDFAANSRLLQEGMY